MRYCMLLAGLMALGGNCLAQDLAELEVDHRLQAAFATPHTDWAVPYALGKTRALVFLRGHDTEPREVVELAQRFDLDPQMVFWTRIIDSTQEHWHGDDRGIQRMARLLTQKWDVYVFLSPEATGVRDVTPDMLPIEQQYALVKAVADGAGLVLVGGDDPRLLKEKNRLKELPALLGDVPGAAAFTVRQGRGVRLPKRPKIEHRPGWEVDYDYWALQAGKAILWAARKEPKLSLSLSPKGKELSRTTLPGTAAQLSWQGAAPDTVADVKVRRDNGQLAFSTRQTLNQPAGTWELAVPRLSAGRYHLDIVARAGDRVAGFANTTLTVTSQRKVEAIALDQDWAEVGQRLSGKVRLAGDALAGERLSIRLVDRRGREIARQGLSASGQAFGFDVQPWFPMLLEVRATLVDDQGEVASAWQYARVVKRHRGRFNFVMWDTPHGQLAPWAEQALANTGITVHLAHGTPSTTIGAYEMAWIPYTTHIGGACQPACWAHEPAIQSHVDGIVEKHVAARRHGVFAYSLGDEIAVRGSCLTPSCLDAYRKYLKEQYQDIAALNASWGSTYGSFDEVQLGKPDDNQEAEALRSGNFPRWFDRQAYQSYNFCRLCERFGKGFRRIDPESRCGFEGAGTFSHADDLDGFVRSNTFWSPYPGTADEVVRSIAPRDFPRSNWMGYTKDPDSLLEKYWRMITRGCDSVWWWRWDALGRFHGWLAPNLDPYPAVEEILRDTEIVRDGLGDLLLASTLQTDGVGILYSLPSGYAAKVQASPSYGSYEGNHSAVHNALRELGLNFLYFTDGQMRRGEVDLRKFKAILLPMTQAMGRQEAEMLRRFVHDGGLLVADVRPAIYDGHLKPLRAGQLDDVFGVRRTGFAEALTAEGVIEVPAPGGTRQRLALAKVRADAGIQATTASAWGSAGKTPLWLVNRFGKGQALLMNLPMMSLPPLGADATPQAAANLLRQVLEQGGVSATLGVNRVGGGRLPGVEITRWTNGSLQIVSVFRHQGRPEPAMLALGQPLCVYELKSHKDHGRLPAASITVTPHRAQFFALSPQPLKPVELKAAPAVSRGSLQQVGVASSLAEGRQAAKLWVTLPDGTAADWSRTVVVADRRGVVVDLPVAYNDPPGEWAIHATELTTGTTVKVPFTVR